MKDGGKVFGNLDEEKMLPGLGGLVKSWQQNWREGSLEGWIEVLLAMHGAECLVKKVAKAKVKKNNNNNKKTRSKAGECRLFHLRQDTALD